MKVFILIVQLTLSLFATNLIAQFQTTPYKASNVIVETIESKMNNLYSGTYSLSRYFKMDTLVSNINPFDYMSERFEDPESVLNDVSIFSCQKWNDTDDSSIVGIFKNGEVIWNSEPIIFGNIENYLVFCKDINNDGVVDIGLLSEHADFTENYNPNNITNYLWILSWNGTDGKFINDYDVSTHKSKLVPGVFNLFDENGDGIYEISSMYSYDDQYTYTTPENLPPEYPYVTYGWNGTKYGMWSNVYQLKYGDFYPAIWINPTIKCKITKENSFLRFNYIVQNKLGSLQDIEDIYILNISVNNLDPRSEYQDSIISYSGIVPNSWSFSPNIEIKSYSGLIEPGETKSGYRFWGNGLPAICDARLQGLIPVEFTRSTSEESISESIYKNSVKRKTLGLKSFPSQQNIIGFIDTNKTYIDSSYSLGWIKNEPTYNKYNTYLTSAKAALSQNNNNTARANLQNILTDVDIDSSSTLTSEAYALLKFNTEYLLEQIPETQTNPNRQ